jgi:hypothetical protein
MVNFMTQLPFSQYPADGRLGGPHSWSGYSEEKNIWVNCMPVMAMKMKLPLSKYFHYQYHIYVF